MEAVLPSPALLAAQEKLLQLRAEAKAKSQDALHEPWPLATGQTPPQAHPTDYRALIGRLPAHLGWGSQGLTAVLRRSNQARCILTGSLPSNGEPASAPPYGSALKKQTGRNSGIPDPSTNQQPPLPATLKLYPDIALGMLRNELAAPGRIWLLLRHMDREGKGVFRIVNLRRQLAGKQTALRVCGWRQMRNLLRQGEGVFWQRDKERLWLRSAAKTAAGLGVGRLTGRPVALPVTVLLGSIGQVRAHLYASFHGSRIKEMRKGELQKPIARATLEQLSGITPQGQRLYEERAGVTVHRNYAVGEHSTPERHQERAWQQGRGVFQLVDHNGRQGRKGSAYLAWQLPNSYHTTYRQRPKGQQKRINRQLADLFMKGMTGNGSIATEKRYYSQAAQAAKAFSRNPAGQVYWQRHDTRDRGGTVWQVMGK
jgi:hypothetical protein